MIIDGNKIAEGIFALLRQQEVPKKELAAILVGDDAASLSFLKQKERTAQSLGVQFKLYALPATLSQKELEDEVRNIVNTESVGGVIVQLPLPKHYDRVPVLNAIGIEKDVDVLNGENASILAPAAGALELILKEVDFCLQDKEVVVVGSGLLIGRPIATWLMPKVKKLIVVNRGGLTPEVTKDADLIISGVGLPGLITEEYVKKDAVVIDYGYAKENGVLVGDVVFTEVSKKTSAITPVPGGTGPIVVAMLFKNFFDLHQKNH